MELDRSAGLLDACPPGLDHAGLEDCALSAHAIQEAFRRAADSLKTSPWRMHVGLQGSGFGEAEPGKHLGPSFGDSEDSCVNSKETKPLGEEQSCVGTTVGGHVSAGGDLVVAPGGGIFDGGKLVFGNEPGPKLGDDGCVEGLPGDTGKEDKGSAVETEEGPILVLA